MKIKQIIKKLKIFFNIGVKRSFYYHKEKERVEGQKNIYVFNPI
jgi:hypothetical protein